MTPETARKVYCELCGDEMFAPPYAVQIRQYATREDVTATIDRLSDRAWELWVDICLICKENLESYIEQLKKKRCNKEDCTTCREVEA